MFPSCDDFRSLIICHPCAVNSFLHCCFEFFVVNSKEGCHFSLFLVLHYCLSHLCIVGLLLSFHACLGQNLVIQKLEVIFELFSFTNLWQMQIINCKVNQNLPVRWRLTPILRGLLRFLRTYTRARTYRKCKHSLAIIIVHGWCAFFENLRLWVNVCGWACKFSKNAADLGELESTFTLQVSFG